MTPEYKQLCADDSGCHNSLHQTHKPEEMTKYNLISHLLTRHFNCKSQKLAALTTVTGFPNFGQKVQQTLISSKLWSKNMFDQEDQNLLSQEIHAATVF